MNRSWNRKKKTSEKKKPFRSPPFFSSSLSRPRDKKPARPNTTAQKICGRKNGGGFVAAEERRGKEERKEEAKLWCFPPSDQSERGGRGEGKKTSGRKWILAPGFGVSPFLPFLRQGDLGLPSLWAPVACEIAERRKETKRGKLSFGQRVIPPPPSRVHFFELCRFSAL